MNDILAAHFQTIRARIEAEVKKHSVIMVTSAGHDDGPRLTSFGLTECLAAAGHQTALVDATTNPAEAVDGRFKTNGRRDYPIYALPRDGSASARARDTIEAFMREVQTAFDYTIVLAPPFGRQSVTVTLAGMVDAVILTIRRGRQPSKNDELMVRALGLAGAHVLGVVAAEPASIEHFEQLGAAQYINDPRPRVAAPSGTVTKATIRIRQAR